MEERIEFALQAMQTLNFRALCQEDGISTKTGYKWKERFLREGMEGWWKSRGDRIAARTSCPKRNCAGTIKLDGQVLFLSNSLADWSGGLKPIAADLMEVWFGRLLLGQIDLRTSNFIRADIRPNKTADQPKMCKR